MIDLETGAMPPDPTGAAMKPKSSVAVILGGGKPEEGPSEESESMDSADEAFMNAAQAAMSAAKSEDASMFADALKDAIDIHLMSSMGGLEKDE